jgi:molybdopterin molybdotransferase
MSSSFADALAFIHKLASSHGRLSSISVPLASSIGRHCATHVKAPIALPPFDNSAMDGFAVSSVYCSDASPEHPIEFTVVGGIAAGDAPPIYSSNNDQIDDTCYEIMTGAAFPSPGSNPISKGRRYDACVRVEHVEVVKGSPHKPERIRLTRPVRPDQERRYAGEDYRQGSTIIEQGTLLQPEHILALASLGVHEVEVVHKAKAVIITTGKELLPLDIGREVSGIVAHLATGYQAKSTIFNSNGPYLRAALSAWGADVLSVLTVGDDPEDFRHTLAGAVRAGADVVLTTGGVSKGRYDYVRPVLKEIGRLVVEGVKMRPGGPVCVADMEMDARRVAIFALPGNPSAAALCARVFVVPYLRARSGLGEEEVMCARLAAAPASTQPPASVCSTIHPAFTLKAVPRDVVVPAAPQRRFIPASIRYTSTGPEATLRRAAGGLVSGLVGADAWVTIDEEQGAFAGEWISCMKLSAVL